MVNENVNIGTIFKRLRKAKRLSQEELAFRCNINRRYIYDLEHDIHHPGFDLFVNLAWALGMEPSELMKELQQNLNLRKVVKHNHTY